MPNEAFFKLEKEKQDILLESAIKEFSELPYAKVSVFKIAQNAQVSRSGFYYYFKDKEDIYQYLLYQIKKEFMNQILQDQKKYDIFSLCKKIFYFIASLKGTERESFFCQVISNMTPEDLKNFFDIMGNGMQRKEFEKICDLNELNPVSDQRLAEIMWLLISSNIYVLAGYMTGQDSLESAEEKLEQMHIMIRHGVLKK